MRLLAALLLLPSAAWANPRIVTEGVYARQVLPATGAPEDAEAQSRVIYLNHTGARVRPGVNDSRRNDSSIVDQPTVIPAWNTDEQTWADTLACFRELWSPFDVEVVDQDPGEVPHIEAIFGGSPAQIGLPGNVLGVSPFTEDCGIIENSIVFVFTDAAPGLRSRAACEVMAQEVAHSYGLDHELLASDPMTYLPYKGNREFQDEDASCGEYKKRPCGVTDSACRPAQNSVQLLMERVGPGSRPPGDSAPSGSDNLIGGCSTSGSPAGLVLVVGLVGLVGLARPRRR